MPRRQTYGHIGGNKNYDSWIKVFKIRIFPKNSDIYIIIVSYTRGKLYWNIKERGPSYGNQGLLHGRSDHVSLEFTF